MKNEENEKKEEELLWIMNVFEEQRKCSLNWDLIRDRDYIDCFESILEESGFSQNS